MQEVGESSNHAGSDDRAKDSRRDSERPINRVADESRKGGIGAESKVERSCSDKEHAQREREQSVTNSRNNAKDNEVPQGIASPSDRLMLGVLAAPCADEAGRLGQRPRVAAPAIHHHNLILSIMCQYDLFCQLSETPVENVTQKVIMTLNVIFRLILLRGGDGISAKN